MSCVQGDSNFTDADAKQCAKQLKDAMDGFGTNEAAIVEVLVTHTNAQRQVLAKTFATAYGKPLVKELISELGGDLEEAVVALMTPPRDYDAKMLYEAMKGAGTDEYTLIGVLCTRSNAEIEEIKRAYKRLYGSELIDDLQGDTSGYFGRMMFSLASASRQESPADKNLAEQEAQKLIDAGVGQFGTDECDFNSVLCLSSYEQLKLVFKIYQHKRDGVTLEQDIESEMSSDLKEGYLAIVKVTNDKTAYFAERLYKAMRGLGTDDSELIRVIVSRSEIDLRHIAKKYEEMYGTRLFDAVHSECGGDYRSLLLSIIAGRYVSKKE